MFLLVASVSFLIVHFAPGSAIIFSPHLRGFGRGRSRVTLGAHLFGGISLLATASPRDANPNQPHLVPSQPAPQPRKKGKFWKTLGLLSLLSIGVGVGLALFTKSGHEVTAIISNYGGAVIHSQQDPNLLFTSVGTRDGHVNILLVGRDRNWKQGKVLDPTTGKFRPYQVEDTDTRPRSDTMIIASFDQNAQTVRFLSIPRDSRVKFRDASGKKHGPLKLNEVYSFAHGDKLLPQVLGDELGIRIDRMVEIKLNGFDQLIERVGGLDINVEGALRHGKRVRMKYEDHWGGWGVDLEPGMQHLDGKQAHGYVRYRKPDDEGDPGRVRRQQQVIRALVKKMMNSYNVGQTLGLVTDIEKMMDSNMSNDELVSAAMFARGLGNSGKISPLTPYGTYEKNGDIKLNRPENAKLFAAIFGASFDPKKLLVLSPETKDDDIGARNNNNPAALPVLREAGLLKAEKHHDAELEAPGLQ